MLTFEQTEKGLNVTADISAQIILQEDADNYPGRENLIYAEHNWIFAGWAYFTADELGNLSEAPVFINMESSTVNIDETNARFSLDDGDMFYFNEYMISDFTEALSRGETVSFTKA